MIFIGKVSLDGRDVPEYLERPSVTEPKPNIGNKENNKEGVYNKYNSKKIG